MSTDIPRDDELDRERQDEVDQGVRRQADGDAFHGDVPHGVDGGLIETTDDPMEVFFRQSMEGELEMWVNTCSVAEKGTYRGFVSGYDKEFVTMRRDTSGNAGSMVISRAHVVGIRVDWSI